MHYGPLFYWQSALISTRVRELGCRFDSTLEVCEDRDFLAQIAEHGDFVFVPAAPTFNYRPDLGTSGTGDGANRNVARVAGSRTCCARSGRAREPITTTCGNRCRQGVRAYLAGDLDGAREPSRARSRSIRTIPTRCMGWPASRGAGHLDERRSNLRAGRWRSTQPPRNIERRWRKSSRAGVGDPVIRRCRALALCPCGSARRYKECCGRLEVALTVAFRFPPRRTTARACRSRIDESRGGNAYVAPSVQRYRR